MNSDRLVLISVLAWAIVPPILMVFGQASSDSQVAENFVAHYIDVFAKWGIFGAVIGFVFAFLTYWLNKKDWENWLKIGTLFMICFLGLMTYQGLQFALYYLPLCLIAPVVFFICRKRLPRE